MSDAALGFIFGAWLLVLAACLLRRSLRHALSGEAPRVG